jgi:replicative DNA helicase
MGDLKDCGEIEQEADQILLVYRDEVYNPDTQEKGIAELLLDKNRHGPTGYVRTYWRGEYMRFDSMTDDYNQAANY